MYKRNSASEKWRGEVLLKPRNLMMCQVIDTIVNFNLKLPTLLVFALKPKLLFSQIRDIPIYDQMIPNVEISITMFNNYLLLKSCKQ